MPENIPPDLFVDQELHFEFGARKQRDAALYPKAVTTGIPLRPVDAAWVESTLAAMTLDEKIGQLFISTDHTNGESLLANYHVGGFCFLGNSQQAANIVATVNRLQPAAKVPLWFSIDSEAGVGARVADATIFPLIMAFGAAGDAELAEECGRITARESQALGIQVTFGPVVDVNTEPLNPIISTRSYAGLPNRVAEMARAYNTGARAEGILATYKHYPGHGATDGDSHSSLPTVNITLEEIERYHLSPYRTLVANNAADLIMSAHVWYSAVHPGTPWPATLSPIFNREILREELGYQGILTSDSYDMAGLTAAVPDTGERAVLGLEGGLDVLLGIPTGNMAASFNAVRTAVNSGRIPLAQVEASVRRVLSAKSRAGLPERALVDASAWQAVLNHPDHRAIVRRTAEEAFSLGVTRLPAGAPLLPTERVLVLALGSTRTIFYTFSSNEFTTALQALHPNVTVTSVSRNVTTGTVQSLLTQAAGFDKVVVLGYDWYRIMQANHVSLINGLAAAAPPVIYVSFGAPYHYTQIPTVDAFYCGYASVPEMQHVAAEVLMGQRQSTGVIPVAVPGLRTVFTPDGFLAR